MTLPGKEARAEPAARGAQEQRPTARGPAGRGPAGRGPAERTAKRGTTERGTTAPLTGYLRFLFSLQGFPRSRRRPLQPPTFAPLGFAVALLGLLCSLAAWIALAAFNGGPFGGSFGFASGGAGFVLGLLGVRWSRRWALTLVLADAAVLSAIALEFVLAARYPGLSG